MTATLKAAYAPFQEADGVELGNSGPGWEYSGADMGDGKLACFGVQVLHQGSS